MLKKTTYLAKEGTPYCKDDIFFEERMSGNFHDFFIARIIFSHLVLSEWNMEVTSASSTNDSISSLSPFIGGNL